MEPTNTGYDQRAVEHVLTVARWHDWQDLLEWLRGEAPNDPLLSPGEYRALRQDAERAYRSGASFSSDPDELWQRLRPRRERP